MSGHLAAKTVTTILTRNLKLADEVVVYNHWRSCPICQDKLRQAISRKAPWSAELPKDTPLFGMRSDTEWSFGMIAAADKLLALTFSEKEFERHIGDLRRKGYQIEFHPTEFLTKVSQTIGEFLTYGTFYNITGLSFYLVKSDFSRQVLTWTGLVPFGEVASYGEIAHWIGHPRAARGVGSALHANPLALVIPCHRIIGFDGRLVGFGGGLFLKRQLLVLEGHSADPSVSVNTYRL